MKKYGVALVVVLILVVGGTIFYSRTQLRDGQVTVVATIVEKLPITVPASEMFQLNDRCSGKYSIKTKWGQSAILYYSGGGWDCAYYVDSKVAAGKRVQIKGTYSKATNTITVQVFPGGSEELLKTNEVKVIE